MYHAQKASHMGGKRDRIGKWQSESFENEVYSIAFIGLTGETKMGHWYNDISTFDLTESAETNNLVSVLENHCNNEPVFLELSDPIFMKQMWVTYHAGESYLLKPTKQFDAIIVYSNIGVLESMKEYAVEGY